MALVIDASLVGAWAFKDENSPLASAVLDRLLDETAVAPSLLWFELRNILVMGERRGRLTEAETASFLRWFGRLGLGVDRAPNEAEGLGLARRYRLTVYAAAYLELALRIGAALATLDAGLAKAARAAGVVCLTAP